jgi:hypothetical protein
MKRKSDERPAALHAGFWILTPEFCFSLFRAAGAEERGGPFAWAAAAHP